MQWFSRPKRHLERFAAGAIALGSVLVALPGVAEPMGAAPQARAPLRREIGAESPTRLRDWCTPSRCRPARGSLASAVAFGIAVVVIHRSARRETG